MEKDKSNVITCGDGWKPLYQPIVDEIINYDIKQTDCTKKIGITAVKEKFGYLEIEVYHPLNVSATLNDKINKACHDSDTICEFCGTKENVGHAVNGIRKVCCEHCFDTFVHPTTHYAIWSTEKRYNLMR